MSDNDDIDPARAAQITLRIGQAFDFVGDAIDDPRTIQEIPSGSVLMFRDVVIGDTELHLTAYAPTYHALQWSARVTGPAMWIETERHRRSMPGLRLPPGNAWDSLSSPEVGESAAQALDRLEAKLRIAQVDWPVRRAAGE